MKMENNITERCVGGVVGAVGMIWGGRAARPFQVIARYRECLGLINERLWLCHRAENLLFEAKSSEIKGKRHPCPVAINMLKKHRLIA